MRSVNTNDLLKTVSDLVSFRTTDSNFGEFDKAVKYIEKFFENERLFIFKHYFNDYPALFISTLNTKKPKVLLQGHLDVVNGKSEQFSPKIKGDKLFGRGTVDMKGFVAVAMHAMKDFAQKRIDAGMMISFDEETGSENGTKKLVEKEKYSCEILLNGDGGYNYAVIHGEKGIVKFELETIAKPGRHPYPWEGANAFDLFIEDYKSITELFPENKFATDYDNWHTTYSIYDINVFNDEFHPPKKVTAKMNIYFTENITTDELCRKIMGKLKHTKIKKFTASERVYENPDSIYIREMQKIMSKNFGREIAIRTENGSSDARFFANKDIPIVIVKTVGEDHHGENEHLLISELMPMYRSVIDFVSVFLQKNIEEKNLVLNNEIK